MKKLLLISVFLIGSLYSGMSQGLTSNNNKDKIIVDNDKLQVVEFESTPGKDVCGPGMHEHEPHLTVVLTDGSVKTSHEGGVSQEFDLKAGTSLWFEADKHEAINNGNGILKVLLVYLKER